MDGWIYTVTLGTLTNKSQKVAALNWNCCPLEGVLRWWWAQRNEEGTFHCALHVPVCFASWEQGLTPSSDTPGPSTHSLTPQRGLVQAAEAFVRGDRLGTGSPKLAQLIAWWVENITQAYTHVHLLGADSVLATSLRKKWSLLDLFLSASSSHAAFPIRSGFLITGWKCQKKKLRI